MTQTEYASRMAWLLAFGKTPDEVAERLEHEYNQFTASVVRAQPHWHTLLPDRTWTPAQEAEHTLLVSEGSTKVAALLLSDKPLRATPHEHIEPDAQGRRAAPPGTLPSEGQAWSELEGRYAASLIALKDAARRAQDGSERRFWHGAVGELTALDWLRMAAYHVRHHRKLLDAGLTQLELTQLEAQA